jgi:transposase
VIERTISWLVNHRRLARRYERLAAHFTAFATIAAVLVCHQRLAKITT